MKTVFFYRDYRCFSGGHLALWRYYNHVDSASGYRAQILFSPETVWDESNPWKTVRADALKSRADCRPDMLLLAGTDWELLEPSERLAPAVPIVNRIASVLHADPANARYHFLHYPAIRICDSSEVHDAILSTGRVNGPVFVIPNGIDVGRNLESEPEAMRNTDVLVAAYKNPKLGIELAARLRQQGCTVELLTEMMPRAAYLDRVRCARVGVFLPLPVEGIYIPPLEAMALKTVVVLPKAIGSGSYCHPGENCFQPRYEAAAILEAVNAALRLSPEDREKMIQRATATAAPYTPESERTSLLEILDQVPELWWNIHPTGSPLAQS